MQRLVRVTVLMSSCYIAIMVDNLADKVNKCLLNVNYVLFVYNWEHQKCLLYGVAGCLLFRGF